MKSIFILALMRASAETTRHSKCIALIAATLIFSFFAMAQANAYECFGAANPSRGFGSDFSVRVDSESVGGKIVLMTDGKQIPLGVITSVGSLERANPNQVDAFNATLGLIWEKDVSGLSEAQIDQVTKIQFIQAVAGESEVSVFQLIANAKQTGGTVYISGAATACVP